MELDRALDSTGQIGEVLGLGEHMRDALWRVESAGLASGSFDGGLLVAGMGGSAIGARIAFGAIGARATGRLALASGYALPPGTTADTLVLCSSYSGNTEETLAAYDAARELGAPRIVSSTGGELVERARADGMPVVPLPAGFQPRHAVGYATVVALEAARLASAAPDLRDEVEAAAKLVEGKRDHVSPLVGELAGRVPVIFGAELTAPVAYRWKCQFNENAKVAAFAAELPEADHNEVCAWWPEEQAGEWAGIFLDDPSIHPRNRRRLEITSGLMASGGVKTASFEHGGDTPLERVMGLVITGDLLSLHVALARGVDPVEIKAIDALKSSLAS